MAASDGNLSRHEHASAIEQFCNENYDDEFMENRFQFMAMSNDDASRAD